MNQLLLFIIIILLICSCKNISGFGIGGQLVIPNLTPRIFYPDSNICEDKREWKKGDLDCLDYSFEGTDCDDIGEDGTSAKESCPISCNSCNNNVLTRKNYESSNEFSDNKMLERLPSPVSEFDGDLSDYGVFGPDMGDELRTSGEADSYTDIYKEEFSKILEKIDELFDITSSQSGIDGNLPGCDILESQTFDPDSYSYLKGYNIKYDNQYKFDDNDEPITYTEDTDPNKNIDEFSFYKLSCDDTKYYYNCNSKEFYNEFNQLRPITELVTCSIGIHYIIQFRNLNRGDVTDNELKNQIAKMINGSGQNSLTGDNIIINQKTDGSLIIDFSIRDVEPVNIDVLNSLYHYSTTKDISHPYYIESDEIYIVKDGNKKSRDEEITSEDLVCCGVNQYYNNSTYNPDNPSNICTDCNSGTYSEINCYDINNLPTAAGQCEQNQKCFDYKNCDSNTPENECNGVCTYAECCFNESDKNVKKICGEKNITCNNTGNKLKAVNLLKTCEEGQCSEEYCCEEVKCQDTVFNTSETDKAVYIDSSINSKTWVWTSSKNRYSSTNNGSIPDNIINSYNIKKDDQNYYFYLDTGQKDDVGNYMNNDNNTFNKLCEEYQGYGLITNNMDSNVLLNEHIKNECCKSTGSCKADEGLVDRTEYVEPPTGADDENDIGRYKCKNMPECPSGKYRKEEKEDNLEFSYGGKDYTKATICIDRPALHLLIYIILIIICICLLFPKNLIFTNGHINYENNKLIYLFIIGSLLFSVIMCIAWYYWPLNSIYYIFHYIIHVIYLIIFFSVYLTENLTKRQILDNYPVAIGIAISFTLIVSAVNSYDTSDDDVPNITYP